VTECFFEMPVELRKHHPELYELLRLFYEQDPAAGAAESGSG
jgi:Mlc titration factor MtfA (ptsG expression regulator)